MIRLLLTVGLCLAATSRMSADGVQDNIPDNVRRIPKDGIEVPAARDNTMRATLLTLQQKLEQLRALDDPKTKSLLPDVMIFERAVRCALDYREFFDPKDLDKADSLLGEGISRAEQLLAGKPEWPNQSGLVVRGYISRIDHTVQPYGLVVPETYAFNRSVPTRCDIWFHGRGETLSEVNFLWDRMKNPGEFTPEHTIMLHPYGRYCNAFKFAGEVDVLEALEDVQKRYRIDEDRISVRGFSMGGAACWQFATHYSDRWFAANPGAGFSETPQFLKVFQKEDLKPTAWEQTLWNLYDCDKWALNLAHCPTIAYSGENDKQKQAADVMEKALDGVGIKLRHIIGKGMGHKYDPLSKDIVADTLEVLAENGRDRAPAAIQFSTHTLKYNRMQGAEIDGLIEHWKPSVLYARWRDKDKMGDIGLEVSTTNVAAFSLEFQPGQLPLAVQSVNHFGNKLQEIHVQVHSSEDMNIPGQKFAVQGHLHHEGPFSDGSLRIVGHRNAANKWVDGPAPDGLRKRHNLQGPIDDAFMDSFVFVRPTGTTANEAVGKWADAELTRAIEHWRRHFRGDARVVNDVDVTDEIIHSANLVLWGDPKSNLVIAKIADKLPIEWTNESVKVGENAYEAAHHAPILIHPNPLNLNRYVVLNSSFTFRDYAYLNNARQVPMLPDWAVIDVRTPPNAVWPGKVVAADFFDEQWQLKP